MAHILSPLARPGGWLGLMLVGCLAALARWAADHPGISGLGLSPLTLAIVLGMALGNTVLPRVGHLCAEGVDFSKNILLRAGIVLYGFRITLQQVVEVGWRGLVADCLVIGCVLALAVALGRRLGVDRDTAILVGVGSSICGAAAILAAEPVLKAPPAKVSVAVATVVLFGTLSMFCYPLMYAHLGLSERTYGLWVGSTVHEVAQVVAAAKAVSETAADVAVVVKMLRVMLLAPCLLIIPLLFGGTAAKGRAPKDDSRVHGRSRHRWPVAWRVQGFTVPWFAVAFLLAICIYSSGVLPDAAVRRVVSLDTVLLTMAMGALGLRTQVSAFRTAGPRPILLALLLFLGLVSAGGLLARSIGGAS